MRVSLVGLVYLNRWTGCVWIKSWKVESKYQKQIIYTVKYENLQKDQNITKINNLNTQKNYFKISTSIWNFKLIKLLSNMNESRALTLNTKAVSISTLGISGYCSRTKCIDKTLALYRCFNGTQEWFYGSRTFPNNLFMQHFLISISLPSSGLTGRLRSVKWIIKFFEGRNKEPGSRRLDSRFLCVSLCIQAQTPNVWHILA